MRICPLWISRLVDLRFSCRCAVLAKGQIFEALVIIPGESFALVVGVVGFEPGEYYQLECQVRPRSPKASKLKAQIILQTFG